MHIRLYDNCGYDLGRSIAEVTDSIHAIGVVKPVYELSTFPLTATANQSGELKNVVHKRYYPHELKKRLLLTDCTANKKLYRTTKQRI